LLFAILAVAQVFTEGGENMAELCVWL
jgi:hypothetical protein